MKKWFSVLSIVLVLFSHQLYGENLEPIEDDMELVYQAKQALKSQTYDKAVDLFKRSLKVREELYGKEHDLTLDNYDGISFAYFNLKDYENAIVYTEKALAIKEKKFGVEHLSTAFSYNNLGIFYTEKDYDKAIKYINKAIEIRIKLLGKDHKTVLDTYKDLGAVYSKQASFYMQKNEYKKALNCAKIDLKISEKILFKNHSDMATSYSNVSLIYKKIGKYDKALNYGKQSLKIWISTLPKSYNDLVDNYNNISEIYRDMGKYKEALKYAKKALKILPNETNSYNNISLIYQDIGEYDKALNYSKKSLNIEMKILPKNYSNISIIYNNISMIYKDMNIYNKALIYVNKSLDIEKRILLKNTPELAMKYNNISLIYQNMGKYSKALKEIKKALVINEEILPQNHPDLATNYNNISLIYKNMGEYPKALKEIKKALAIIEEVLPKNHHYLATIYNNVSLIYKDMEDYEKALIYVKKSLRIHKKILSKNHPDIATGYTNISILYRTIKKYNKAYFFSKKAFNIFLKNRDKNFLILTSKEKEKYLKSNIEASNFFLIAIDFIIDLQKKRDKEKLNKILIDLVNAQLNYKGSILDSENAIDTLYSTTKDKKLKKQIKKWKSKKRYLAKLSQTVPKENQKVKRENGIKKLEKEIADLSYIFSKKALKFKEEENLSTISGIDIASNLKEDELYFDILYLNNEYYTFVLDRERISFTKYDENQSKQINTITKSFRTDIKTILDTKGEFDNNNSLEKLTQSSKEKLSKLYDLILTDNIKERLKNKTSLIIAPDGLLRLLPFEALYDKNSSQYFIQQKEIRYVPSGKELVRLYKYRQYETTDSNQSVIFANPKFDANITSNVRSSNLDLRVSDLGTLYMKFGELNGTKYEAKAIKKIWGEKRTLSYQEMNATEANLFNTKQPNILHIATHGFFINSSKIFNPMLKSGIALSGANISVGEGRSDGVITALKLSGLNLRGTDLVVLSACNTGTVDINSTDSVSGLSKAFIQAGAKDVVMSLWSVDDMATKNLMKFFYQKMKSEKNYSHALRNAKIEMIENGDDHPFYWAGFLINGL